MKKMIQMRRDQGILWNKGETFQAEVLQVRGHELAWVELPEGHSQRIDDNDGMWIRDNQYVVTSSVDEPQTEEEVLVDLLAELFADRSDRINDWPEDEAEAYRKYSLSEGAAAVRRVRLHKAAATILSLYDPKAKESS